MTLQFFQSEQFQKLWDEANRNAHEQVVKALTGSGKVIKTKNGEVVLDLSALVVQLRSELSERGIGIFDKLPIGKLSLQFELFDAEGLKNAQAGVQAARQARDRPADPRDRVRGGRHLARRRPPQGTDALGDRGRDRLARARVRAR